MTRDGGNVLRKVCIVITARPSYSRVKSVLSALKGRCELQIIAAASALVTRYGRIVDQIRADGFKVTMEIPSVLDGNGLRESAVSTGVLLTQLGSAFAALEPDMVVTIADRHETLATAAAASYQNIPLCHLQGGEVTGSIDDKVRNAITQLADVHCVATEKAAERVTLMTHGLKPVILTGCPSIDLAREALELGPLPSAEVVVLMHPVTDQEEIAGEQMDVVIEAVSCSKLSRQYFWPGEDAGSEAMCKSLRLADEEPIRNMPPIDFLRTLMGARVLVGNSSVGIREGSFLGVPTVNIGTRQDGRERAENVIDVPNWADDIRKGIVEALEMFPTRPGRTLYGDGYSGERIATALAGKAEEAAA